MQIKLTTCSGEQIAFSRFAGWVENTVNEHWLVDTAERKGIERDQIQRIELAGKGIEIQWGPQFRAFRNLKEVHIKAAAIIKVGCANFEGAGVRIVTLEADKITFGDGAFMNAPELTEVYISGTVLGGEHGGLPEALFKNCQKLERIVGTYRGEKIMPCAFENCPRLTRPMELYVKDLGYQTFAGCTALKELHLHNGLETMGHSAFTCCVALEDIYVPDTVQDLGTDTFQNCAQLKSIHLPAGIRRIPAGFLKYCSALEKCYIPDTVESIETGAFACCERMESPFIPEGLKYIGSHAFYRCTSMRSIFLPSSVTEIASDAFEGCRLTIKGEKGSYAEGYAAENNIPFKG